MSLFARLFARRPDRREAVRPLYRAIVGHARTPAWYLDGAPDTFDGRFDMIAALLSLVLLRLEGDVSTREASVAMTELFVDDMDGQLRQIGIGDIVVGKHIGNMMGALGGRLGAYRDAGADAAALRTALVRNVWRDADPGAPADRVAARMAAFRAALAASGTDAILAGQLPPLAP